jgi:hypothetical protein
MFLEKRGLELCPVAIAEVGEAKFLAGNVSRELGEEWAALLLLQ